MDSTEKEVPQSLKIVETDSDNTVVVDLALLKSILSREELKDRYVSIISINGTFRQGKSFLLNFLLRYLRVRYIEKRNVNNWLKPEDGPVQGFSFTSGSKRHTTGIHMWSEIFYTTLPSGEQVAIILLDSQGAFDTNSSMNNSANIFAFSTLVSSVQICNIMRSIKQYDLSHLEVFGGYGSLLTSGQSSCAFQSLYFLVRDWACDYEHPYGHSGGSSYLEEVFSSDSAEMRKQVDNVKSLFKNVDCFLLPYPGRTVDVSKNFVGDLNEIDEEFKDHVEDLAPLLLSPENLILKEINGEKKTASELLGYIQEYSRILVSGTLPKIQTFFKATVEAHYKQLLRQSFNFYKKNMDLEVMQNLGVLTRQDFKRTYETCRSESIEYFENNKKFEDEEIYNKYYCDLENKIQESRQEYESENEKQLRIKQQEEELQKRREAQRRQAEERKRFEERRAEERRRAVQRRQVQPSFSSPGSSQGGSDGGLLDQISPQAIGTAAAVVGTGAVLAFGLAKFFAGSKNND